MIERNVVGSNNNSSSQNSSQKAICHQDFFLKALHLFMNQFNLHIFYEISTIIIKSILLIITLEYGELS